MRSLRCALDEAFLAWSRWATTYLALWGFVLLSGFLSELPHTIGSATGILVLAAVSVDTFARTFRQMTSRRDVLFVVLLLLGAAATLMRASPSPLFAATWVIGIVGLDRRTHAAKPLARALATAGILGTILSLVPGIWNAVNSFSVLLTTAVFSWAGGGGLGVAASGLYVFILVSPILMSNAFGRSLRRPAPLIAGLALLAVHAGIASICGLPPQARLIAELLYIGALLGVSAWTSRTQTAPAAARRWGKWEAFVCLAVIFGLAGSLAVLPTILPGRAHDEPRTVQFVDQTLLGSWDTPRDALPGTAFTGATFGMFSEYVEAYGHRTFVTDGMEDGIADDVDLVVIINPGKLFTAAQKNTLYAFVEQGGGLLVLGDHTNMGGIMDAVNGLTSPLGLSLVFDSAVSMEPGWPSTLRVFPQFSTGLHVLEIPVSIGASIDAVVHPAIEPLLAGRRAFSDPGELGNEDRALLGNLAFDRGERYGDVVLAAVRYLGRGKVALFGDTSPFQNSALSYSYAFADRLVRWLTDRTGSWRVACLASCALLLCLVAMLLLRRSDAAHAGILALVVIAGLVSGHVAGRWGKSDAVASVGTARIDAAHANLIRVKGLDPRGVEGLSINLARQGLLPMTFHEDLVRPAPSLDSVILSTAPTRPFSAREVRDLRLWVKSGGRLIITTGWPQSTALEPFLGSLGISIQPIPLGSSRPDVVSLDVSPEFPSAWPLGISDEWTPLGSIEWDNVKYVVAALRSYGSGWIIIIGDNEVFSNSNLEGKGFAFIENIDFLTYLLAIPRGGVGSR